MAEGALRAPADGFSIAVREFLDAYDSAASDNDHLAMRQAEPVRLGGEDWYQDGYLAAGAETLAHRMRRKKPTWVHEPSRIAEPPWFAHTGGGWALLLLIESPAALRARRLFVSANALSRALT